MVSQEGPIGAPVVPNVTYPNIDHETEVLVSGGGPVGMLAAYRLAQLGQTCMMVEQSTKTTTHPKMELTNCRSMELMRKMGVADRLRAVAVPERYPLTEIYSTGFSKPDGKLSSLLRPSPAAWRETFLKENDGSHTREPHMRLSQIIFEAWFKTVCQAEPLIDDRWGYTFKSLVEYDDHVLSIITDAWGKDMVVKSKYVLGCDGAGSPVRMAAGLEAKRKSLPFNFLMIHFKTKNLEQIYSQGQFWHFNFLTGAVIVSQDEKALFTVHKMVPPDTDAATVDAKASLAETLGGLGQPYELEDVEILVKSNWKCDLAVAGRFRSAKGRVFLAGDAAHQLSPAGGNGLNSGIGDVFDLTWKLAAVLKGYGGPGLLDSYDHERRPVAKNNASRVEQALMEYFGPLFTYAGATGLDTIHAQDAAGDDARRKLQDLINSGVWVHSQEGTWVDYRYAHSPVNSPDPEAQPPKAELLRYVPSTYPGHRAPHVFLADGATSVFDLLGQDFSVVDFTPHGEASDLFLSVAKAMGVPLTRVALPNEIHARQIWERDLVLVRPDHHVAWRAPVGGVDALTIGQVRDALAIATGRKISPGYKFIDELKNDEDLPLP